MIAVALIVALSLQVPVALTDAERARVGVDWTGYLDQNCQPRTRAIEHNREVVRFQCPEGVEIVDVASGTVTPERRSSVGATLKRWGWLAVVGTVGVIYLLGHPE